MFLLLISLMSIFLQKIGLIWFFKNSIKIKNT